MPFILKQSHSDDGAHDAAANHEQLQAAGHVDYLINWNPRGEDPQAWCERAEREGCFVAERADKRVATFDETMWVTTHWISNHGPRVLPTASPRQTARPFL
jgi:hypothetical protein